MNYQEFQQQGYLITEKEQQALYQLIADQYKEVIEQINGRLAVLYAKTETLTPAERYNWLIQYDRNIKLKADIQALYTKYDQKAGNIIKQIGKLGIENNYYRQLYALSWTGESISFAIIDENLVNYAVTGQLESWSKLKKYIDARISPPDTGTLLGILKANRSKVLRTIQGQINSGLVSGDSYANIARKVRHIIGSGLKDDKQTAIYKALRIVRTEGNRLLNTGSLAAGLKAEEQGVTMRKMWDATLDLRTRAAHGAADNQKRTLDKSFSVAGEALMYPGDSVGSAGNVINCRCTSINLAGDFEPQARRGRNPITGKTEVFDYKDYAQWLEDRQ